MFFELHSEHKIGYKILSDADLGIGESSHQTHIGLSESVLTFLPDRDEISEDSIFIYEYAFAYIDAYFDRIERPDGTFRSPKIRTGGRDCVSVVSMIREKAKSDLTAKWFLLWFGLENEKIAFFLFNNLSSDYTYISKSGLDLETQRMGVIDDQNPLFNIAVEYLETKINHNADFIIKELEVASQVEQKQFDKRFNAYDIERANKYFKETGARGEQLVNEFLKDKLFKGEIAHFTWYNETKESGLPYDFHIENNDGSIVYIDVKATSYDFEQKIIFSSQEISFIAGTEYRYCIYRVYINDKQEFSLRICDDCKSAASKINDLTDRYRNDLLQIKTDLRSAKFAISPSVDDFKFKPAIFLREVNNP